MRSRAAIGAILATGALLRALQFWPRRSLWLDEIMIALNVTERSAGRLLLEPLDHFQVAPVGFLALEKLGVFLLGDGELGLRFFPFLFGIASLVLFWRVAARFLSGAALLAALTLFSVSPALVWYSGNAKPYAGDVFVTLLLVLLGLRLRERRIPGVREAALWGGVGGLAVLISQPAVLVAAAVGAVLLLEAWRARSRETRRAALVLVGGWGVGAAITTAAAFVVAAPETIAYMQTAWADYFLPAPWGGFRALVWIPERLLMVLAHLVFFFRPLSTLERLFVGALAPLGVAGVVFLIRRRRPELVLLAIPVVAGILAASFRLLPLEGRAAIYMGPSLLIVSMAGISWLGTLPRTGRRMAAAAALVVAGLPAVHVLAAARPPYRIEETRPVLEAIRSRWRAGDELYAYYGADYAMEFYGPRLGYRDWTRGNCHRGATRAYLKELDAFRGRPRVWVLFTHAYEPYSEAQAIRSYLETIGTEIDRIEDPFGNEGASAAEAYLYDLSDPARLARATAGAHPLPEATGEGEPCVEFPRIEIVGTLLEPAAVEAMVAYLDSDDEESRARAESEGGIELPDHAVFVLTRENLQRHAGMSLEETQSLVGALHRRGVAARWCQARCPARGGDQTLTFRSLLALSRDRILVTAQVRGFHTARTFRDPLGLTGWIHEVGFHLRKESGRWVVTHYSVGSFADTGPSRSSP